MYLKIKNLEMIFYQEEYLHHVVIYKIFLDRSVVGQGTVPQKKLLQEVSYAFRCPSEKVVKGKGL